MLYYIKDLWLFIHKPSPTIYDNNKTFKKRILSVFVYYLWEIIFLFPVIATLAVLNYYGLLPENANKLNTKVDFWENLFLICLAVPLIEEIIFRSHLASPRWSIVACLVSIICGILFIFEIIIVDFNSKLPFLVSVFLVSISSFLFSGQFLINIWHKYYFVIFYSIVFAFSLVHLTNFDYKKTPTILFPVLLTAQFLGGVFLGFIRLKYGFWYSVLSHCWFNFVLLTIKYINYGF